VGAVAGGALAASSASKSNRNVKKAALANYNILNEQIEQSRFAFFDNANRLGQTSQANLGNFYLATAGKTGGAYNAVSAQIARDAAVDSLNLREGQKNTEKSIELQKENVRIGAQANLQNVPVAALGGAISGASTAVSLYSAFQSSSQQSKGLRQQQQATQVIQQFGNAGLFALNQGAPPSAILSGQINPNTLYNSNNSFRDSALNSAREQNNSFFNTYNQSRLRFR